MAKTKLYTFYMSPYGAPTKHVVKMASLRLPFLRVAIVLASRRESRDSFLSGSSQRSIESLLLVHHTSVEWEVQALAFLKYSYSAMIIVPLQTYMYRR